MVTDVKSDNFMLTKEGDLSPIDLIVQHFSQGHPLHRLFSENLIE
jgi:hypothetical protein